MNRGVLYGVSTGPGDAELITIKAYKCLENVGVIAVPRTKGTNTLALDIVSKIVDLSKKTIIYLDFAMTKDQDVLKKSHRDNADRIEEYLNNNQDVAMLNLGDASLYGTYGYIRDIVAADGYNAVTIPGVTSFCASAAEMSVSLTSMNEPLTIIPGTIETIADNLDSPGTKVIMKSGSKLNDVKTLLNDNGLSSKSKMVVNCGLEGQKIYKDINESGDNEGYFVTILVSDVTE